ncbi:MAG: arylamine N-acetyltransferase [Proteobacteria bacterium]|nr:arylamine N-acetyltransferase [Pseudomonadota bacterium]
MKMPAPDARLDNELVTRILAKLGLDDRPATSLQGIQGLKAIYGAWCQKIPFDNLKKRIHLESSTSGPLPGNDPTDFFHGWLQHGVGGTCWAGSGALYALLRHLGFQAQRVLATMQVTAHEQPNHGAVIAVCEEVPYLVDISMLHQVPLRLDEQNTVDVSHPAWGISGRREDAAWLLQWRPLHMPGGCRCTVNEVGVSHRQFVSCNEQTRRWGPFNFSVYVRTNKGDTVTGLAYGYKIRIDSQGRIERIPVDSLQRDRFLMEEMGFSREIVRQLPPDRAAPPPPRRTRKKETS